MPIGYTNDQLIAMLAATFQRRNEANFAWKSACSAYLALPGLRGFWPMSSVDDGGDCYDLSGQGRTLTLNGAPTYWNVGLAPCINLGGAGYLERADEAGLDILGTETFFQAAGGATESVTQRGITFGAWATFDDATPAAHEFVLSKGQAAAANISYSLFRLNTTVSRINIAGLPGPAIEAVGNVSLTADVWWFLVGKWIPSTEISMFVNDAKATAASALTSINNTGSPFQIGGRDNGAGGSTQNMDGRVSMVFLCGCALADAIIKALFQQTRCLFGV